MLPSISDYWIVLLWLGGSGKGWKGFQGTPFRICKGEGVLGSSSPLPAYLPPVFPLLYLSPLPPRTFYAFRRHTGWLPGRKGGGLESSSMHVLLGGPLGISQSPWVPQEVLPHLSSSEHTFPGGSDGGGRHWLRQGAG